MEKNRFRVENILSMIVFPALALTGCTSIIKLSSDTKPLPPETQSVTFIGGSGLADLRQHNAADARGRAADLAEFWYHYWFGRDLEKKSPHYEACFDGEAAAEKILKEKRPCNGKMGMLISLDRVEAIPIGISKAYSVTNNALVNGGGAVNGGVTSGTYQVAEHSKNRYEILLTVYDVASGNVLTTASHSGKKCPMSEVDRGEDEAYKLTRDGVDKILKKYFGPDVTFNYKVERKLGIPVLTELRRQGIITESQERRLQWLNNPEGGTVY